jgi:hypothetical protein
LADANFGNFVTKSSSAKCRDPECILLPFRCLGVAVTLDILREATVAVDEMALIQKRPHEAAVAFLEWLGRNVTVPRRWRARCSAPAPALLDRAPMLPERLEGVGVDW